MTQSKLGRAHNKDVDPKVFDRSRIHPIAENMARYFFCKKIGIIYSRLLHRKSFL